MLRVATASARSVQRLAVLGRIVSTTSQPQPPVHPSRAKPADPAKGETMTSAHTFRKGPSGFYGGSTAEQVLAERDLTGKVALVTGANSGLGTETAQSLALSGAHVFVGARSEEKAAKAIATMTKYIAEKTPGAKPQFTPLIVDLASLASVKAATESFKAAELPLDILICNAAIMQLPERQETEDGFEAQMGTNHLGHHALVVGLIEELRKAEAARVVVVSSVGAKRSNGDFIASDTLESPTYDPGRAYGNAKLASILFADELNHREAGNGIKAFSLHPGGIFTNLQKHVSWGLYLFWLVISPIFFKSVPQGAATSVYCATFPGLEGGAYCEDCNVSQVDKSIRALRTPENAAKLFATTEALTGIKL